jgi:hypothetical protein
MSEESITYRSTYSLALINAIKTIERYGAANVIYGSDVLKNYNAAVEKIW